MVAIPLTPGFTDSNFYLKTNTKTFTSPINRVTQSLELAGAQWYGSFTLPRMDRTKAAAWIAFFMLCKGMSETFNMRDPDWKINLGPGTGTPLVNGDSQLGNTLIIDGCTVSTLGWLKIGDYFSVGGKLKRMTANADTDSGGNTTLTFEPPIDTSPADNDAVTTVGATCEMILADDSQASWPCDKNGIYQEKTFVAYEPLR